MTRRSTHDFPTPELVNRAIAVPHQARQGIYREQLIAASKLEPTSREKGLKPHYKFSFDSHEQGSKFLSGISAAWRRVKARGQASEAPLLEVKYMLHNDRASGKYVMYLWRQERGEGKRK